MSADKPKTSIPLPTLPVGPSALAPPLHPRPPSTSPAPSSRLPLPSRTPSASPSPPPSASARNPSPYPTSSAPDSEKPDKKKSSKAEKAAEAAAEAAALATERAALQATLDAHHAKLSQRLVKLETEIGLAEDDYIRITWAHGNVLRGWDGFGRRVDRAEKSAGSASTGLATGAPKHRKSRPADRIFSLTSATSTFRAQNPDAVIQKRAVPTKKKKKR